VSKTNNRITNIKRYMEEHTDEMHPVTIADILARLKAKGIESSRQTTARDIQQLIDTGTDVVCKSRDNSTPPTVLYQQSENISILRS
jgi:DNA-binding PadR family transcriptional regulator